MALVHVVGAGLAGLASAVRLAERGRRAVVHEGAQQAGGRCRSYFDRALGRTIDNGNHLLLSGNRSAIAYLRTIGATHSLIGPEQAVFPFVDLESGARWTVRPNRGRLPWWVAVPHRRVPDTRLSAYLTAAWSLARAGPDDTIGDRLDARDPLWRAFWDPLVRAILNTPPETASARLLWQALKESFAGGGAGCRPLVAGSGLSESFVHPALRYLAARGIEVGFGQRLRSLEVADGRVRGLDFGERVVKLEADDKVVLGLPPAQTAALLPDLVLPREAHAIVNGHFCLPEPVRLPQRSVLLGVIGGTAQWIFARGPLISLTVSAADDLADDPAEAVALRLWSDTARALGLPSSPLPPWRIVKEKRATFAQTPAAAHLRPGPRTALANLLLAGDWTATGLPATIEGAIRSGQRAADLLG
jgi:squalene-associated FAD-dependent desaturase